MHPKALHMLMHMAPPQSLLSMVRYLAHTLNSHLSHLIRPINRLMALDDRFMESAQTQVGGS